MARTCSNCASRAGHCDTCAHVGHRTDPLLVGATCHLANPHSNAVVDLNGDCLAGKSPQLDICTLRLMGIADLFLVCEEPASHERSYQIWINTKDKGFTLVSSGPLPDGAGAISFADMGTLVSSCM